MKKLIPILILIVSMAMAVIPQDIIEANNDMLTWMDKYTWTTYTNPYTGEIITITAAERLIAKNNAIDAYNLWKSLALEYAQELGLIN